MSESQTKAGNQRKFENFWNFLKIWKFEILNSLSWSSGHAEQLLFSYLCWKVTVYSWKLQCFFLTSASSSREFRVHRAGSQLKRWFEKSHERLQNLIFWKLKKFSTKVTMIQNLWSRDWITIKRKPAWVC